MNATLVYSCVLVANRLTVVVRQSAITEEARTLEIRVDGAVRAQVTLRPWNLPCFAATDDELVVWGGVRAYFLAAKSEDVLQVGFEEEICALYRLSTSWCVICEASILLWQREKGVQVAQCQHDEVFVDTWWEGSRLLAKDLRDRVYEVIIDEPRHLVELRTAESTRP